MNFFQKFIDTIKYIIDDIKMMDFQNYMKKHDEIYKKSIVEFNKNFYYRNIIRRTLITLPLFLFFPNIITITLAILGLAKSTIEWETYIFPCLKFKNNKKEEQSQIFIKKEKDDEDFNKEIIYKVNDKEISFEEIIKKSSDSKNQNDELSKNLTKNKKL